MRANFCQLGDPLPLGIGSHGRDFCVETRAGLHSRTLDLSLQHLVGAGAGLQFGIESRLLELGLPGNLREFDLLTGALHLRSEAGFSLLLNTCDLGVMLAGQGRFGLGAGLASGDRAGRRGVDLGFECGVPRLFRFDAQPCQLVLQTGVGRLSRALDLGLQHLVGAGAGFQLGIESRLLEMGLPGDLREFDLLTGALHLRSEAGFSLLLDTCDFGIMLAVQGRFGLGASFACGGREGRCGIDLGFQLGVPRLFCFGA